MGSSKSRPISSATSKPGVGAQNARKLTRRYTHIADQYRSLDQVQVALRQAGLESSNLIVGIDCTKSNEWTGKYSFQGRSLHAIGDEPNPYEQAISIIGRTLSVFDDDNLIPCFGFGDATTHDQYVFSFYQDHRPCQGFDETLARYRQIIPNVRLAGPTSFAPIIDAAVSTVVESGGQYHVLVIIADGQVTRSVDTSPGNLSPQERSTIDAIVRASDYPLSIILVGVGDGPWDMMRAFDDNIPTRAFDNFQFVNFSELMARSLAIPQKEALFALSALMEIPSQYKATVEFGLLGRETGQSPKTKRPLGPPPAVLQADFQVLQGFSRMAQGTKSSGFKKYPPDPYSAEPNYSSLIHGQSGVQNPQNVYPPAAQAPSSQYGLYEKSNYAAQSYPSVPYSTEPDYSTQSEQHSHSAYPPQSGQHSHSVYPPPSYAPSSAYGSSEKSHYNDSSRSRYK